MTPSNGHEREIAEIVDRIASRRGLALSSIQEIVGAIDFMMTSEDSRFFIDYFQWRVDNPL